MKKAVVVVGPHFSGKSKTIKKYFKRLVGLSEGQRSFTLRDKLGRVLSQSLEEKRLGRVLSQTAEEKRLPNLFEFLSRYLSCNWLVMAARPRDEPGSHYREIVATLKQSGFSVHTVYVRAGEPESFYKLRAAEILAHLT